ncbi:MAG: hypothetical protein AB7S54_11740 [Bacteroidales bacterium]
MKRILYILSLLALAPLFFVQCADDDDMDNFSDGAKAGGLMDVLTPSINYVVGNNAAYNFSSKVYQGKVKTTKLYYYKSFYSVADDTVGGSPYSNEVLAETVSISEQVTHQIVSSNYLYSDLISNLTLNGAALPTADNDLNIGDAFYFRIVAELEDGRQVEQATRVKLTVSTRYAGKYRTTYGEYFRLGVLTYTTGDWPAELVIESVDAITYKQVEYMSAFEGNTLYFQIVDGKISYPLTWGGVAQVLNDYAIITCADNAADMTHVHCATSNYVINDDVNGKDRLIMSIGYYTTGSGPREFYQELEKIVE